MNLQSLSDDLVRLVAATASSSFSLLDDDARVGSAIAWDAHHLVTAAHRIDDDAQLVVENADGAHLATLIGRDATTDLALLRVEGVDLTPATWRTADVPVQVGELALPLAGGPSPSVQLGVVSRVGGPWQTRRGGRVDRWIEVDASLPGAAVGGATVDASGRVLGLSTSKLTPVGALLPHETVADRVARLLAAGADLVPGWLGVRFARGTLPATADQPARDVLLVAAAMGDGPAAQAGLSAGDALLALDGAELPDLHTLHGLTARAGAGATVTLTRLRSGADAPDEVAVTLGERPRWGRGGPGRRGGWGRGRWAHRARHRRCGSRRG